MYTNFRYKNDKFKKQFYILKIFDKHKKIMSPYCSQLDWFVICQALPWKTKIAWRVLGKLKGGVDHRHMHMMGE